MDQCKFITKKELVKNEDFENEPTKDLGDGQDDIEAQIETNEEIIDQKDENLLNVLLKPTNPWEVSSLYEFNYFCCPECDIKSTSAQEFINHASYYHPWALDSLQQISDGSLDEIEFPNLKIKQEEGLEDFDLPTDCLEVDMIGKNDTVRKRRIKKSYFCHLCNKTYRDSWKLKRHVKVHIKAGELPEGATFEPLENEITEENTGEKVNEEKRTKNYHCQVCSKSFYNNYRLKLHEEVHIKAGELPEPPDYEPLKDKVIGNKEDIENNHSENVKILKPKRIKRNFHCRECNKSFLDSWKLRRHERVHLKLKSPEETIDGQTLGEAYNSYLKDFFQYEAAIRKENGKIVLKYSCLLCLPELKVIITQKNPIRYLGNHMRSIHPQLLCSFDKVTQCLRSKDEPNLPDTAPFTCPNCQLEFPSYVILKSHWQSAHKIIDKNETSMLCNLCGKTFLKKTIYTRHMWSEHKIGKPQESECDVCGKIIQGGKAELLRHKVVHKETKDHVCHICGAGFVRVTSLKYHNQRVHEHNGNYACMYCDFKTVTMNHLDVHVNAVHTKSIKYSCDECNFSCYTKGNLTAHRKTVHLKLKPHKCHICPEAYIRKSELEKHKSATGHFWSELKHKPMTVN